MTRFFSFGRKELSSILETVRALVSHLLIINHDVNSALSAKLKFHDENENRFYYLTQTRFFCSERNVFFFRTKFLSCKRKTQ